jgi:hypothetical protein
MGCVDYPSGVPSSRCHSGSNRKCVVTSRTLPSTIIFAPFVHRDDERLPFADRFSPDVWLEDRPAEDWTLIPFSAGLARCPSRQLVLRLTKAMLVAQIDGRQVIVEAAARLELRQPLPATLNKSALRCQIGGRP